MAGLKYADAQRLSHAYIISANQLEEGMEIARDIAAASVCTASVERPCRSCRDCRKAMADIHPDIITLHHIIDDKGKEKREYTVDQIRGLIADACVLPNEAKRKVYIIPKADTMNTAAQNAALKLLEEPPKGVVLLLVTCNSEMLLTTVRSRCVEIFANDNRTQNEDGGRETAREFIKTAASGDRAKLFAWCAANEGMDTRSASEFIESAYSLTADMLCSREPKYGMSNESIAALNALLRKCGAYLKVNTGVKHIFGLLAVRAVEERIQN